jgi:succinate-acetate transporter protein
MQESRGAVPQPLVVQPAAADPAVLGLGVFVLGSIMLGLNLVDYVTPGGSVLAIISAGTGLFLLLVTLWCTRLGQTYLAAVFGIFSAFWLTYSALLLGLFHNWYAIPAEGVPDTIRAFLIAWSIALFLLTVSALRLPVAFPILFGMVDLAVIIVAVAWLADTPPNTDLLKVGGYVVFAFAALGAYAFLGAASASLGGRGYPLGPPLVK